MCAARPQPISIESELASLRFLADRRPTTTPRESEGAFRRLTDFRDGGVFVTYWAGESEWERHANGDELVMVVEGRTTIFFLDGQEEHAADLGSGELVVVPQGTWHRFETPDGVKVLTVTPLPTDHSEVRPE